MTEPLADRMIRKQGWLEPIADVIQNVVGGFYRVLGSPGRALKNILHGTAILGHPLHPAATDVPLGAWVAGLVADWAAVASSSISSQAGDIALAVGMAGAIVSAMSGYTDFHETYAHERRVAVTHGLFMTVVVVLQAVSIGLRFGAGADMRIIAVVISTVAVALMLLGAYLGGHVTFGIGTMVNRTAFLEGPEDYVPIGAQDDFPDGKMRRVEAGGMALLVVRRGKKVYAIANTCSHAGGPLDEGSLEGDTVTCPWHGSRFCVTDGRVKDGPATFPQPVLLVRQFDGQVEVKLEVPLH